MTSPISFNRSAAGTSAQNARTDNDAGSTARAGAQTDASQEQPSVTSVLVQFSDEVRKRIDSAMRTNMSKINESKQDLARGRIEEIKRRIQMLKMMMMMSPGQSVPPGVLREIRQLAAELGQAAKTLNDGGGNGVANAGTAGGEGSSGAVANGVGDASASALSGAMSVSAAGENASAESDGLGGEDQAVGASPAAKSGEEASAQEAEQLQNVVAAITERGAGSQQRRMDAKSVQDAVRELKSLLAMVKNASKNDDKEAQKQIQVINQSIADIEKTVQSMNMTGSGADISVDLSVGPAGNVSIDVQV
ncbi:cell envelope biogenesis protein TolA [Dickeya dadantii]|uniref:cell envelope biogenesis protein TolA n=1 Tax=Dickeya dadantii TaxID=204038 RepID=UPI0014954E8C|nr:cell envelope biogenesis protein TolA [Dickeya dadantii]NPE52607.1 cell envelope biogenesis protein TolA [Dickeya dadantii]